MYFNKLFAVVVAGAVLVGCSSTQIPDPDPVQSSYPGSGGADTAGAGSGGMGGGEFYDDGDAAEELGSTVYFDFDSSEVRAEDRDLVAEHAISLGNNSYSGVRLEGHADERGSREYNIGLGERRAQAVRQMLMIQGVDSSQIQTVSFGEERPESLGSSDSDYAQNRRVVITYTN